MIDPLIVQQWSAELSAEWLRGVRFGKPATYGGYQEIAVVPDPSIEASHRWRLRANKHFGGWNVERRVPNSRASYIDKWEVVDSGLPLKTAKAVVARELKGLERPLPVKVRYDGGAPLKRKPPEYAGAYQRDLLAESRARIRRGEIDPELHLFVNPEESQLSFERLAWLAQTGAPVAVSPEGELAAA